MVKISIQCDRMTPSHILCNHGFSFTNFDMKQLPQYCKISTYPCKLQNFVICIKLWFCFKAILRNNIIIAIRCFQLTYIYTRVVKLTGIPKLLRYIIFINQAKKHSFSQHCTYSDMNLIALFMIMKIQFATANSTVTYSIV